MVTRIVGRSQERRVRQRVLPGNWRVLRYANCWRRNVVHDRKPGMGLSAHAALWWAAAASARGPLRYVTVGMGIRGRPREARYVAPPAPRPGCLGNPRVSAGASHAAARRRGIPGASARRWWQAEFGKESVLLSSSVTCRTVRSIRAIFVRSISRTRSSEARCRTDLDRRHHQAPHVQKMHQEWP